jgi:hypothetical protein
MAVAPKSETLDDPPTGDAPVEVEGVWRKPDNQSMRLHSATTLIEIS